MKHFVAAVIWLALSPSLAVALTGSETCTRMIAGENSGDMDMSQCLCLMKQGDKYLDSRVVSLWREALYFKESRMEQISKLGISEARLSRQLKKTARAARRNCGIKW